MLEPESRTLNQLSGVYPKVADCQIIPGIGDRSGRQTRDLGIGAAGPAAPETKAPCEVHHREHNRNERSSGIPPHRELEQCRREDTGDVHEGYQCTEGSQRGCGQYQRGHETDDQERSDELPEPEGVR